MNLLARLKMTFDGQLYATEERSTEIDVGGADNDPVVDASGNTHTSESMKPGMFKTNLLVTDGFKVRELQAMNKGTIVAEGNNNCCFIMRNAKCGNARSIRGGKIEATFYGDVEEI
jgi:hypothetical protein